MKQAITETVSYLDGLKYISRKEHLIQIYFYAKDRNTYVSLTTNNYYLKDSTIAYGIVDGYTCVYYGSEKIGCKYLDADKLIVFKDSIANFKSYDEVGGHYDPTGIVFRIVDMDSLAIVKKGMI
ncbi:MAG: hypothetical protein LBN06_02510 [Prevotellaceae bacterium]|jgi:hypothetical protein|nr:hypothetical protein [Prevotellaceae bacterium]